MQNGWKELAQKKNITAGDIVAVKGGKISRDLTGAEQVMAVSYRPIVLGNIPDMHKENKGNKVAFMGQLPVKLMGPVRSGDYIVAFTKFPGYGMAISPNKMQAHDYNLTVGRAWQTNLQEGPKLINTIVGNHNKTILEIVTEEERQLSVLDKRINALDEKANAYLHNIKNVQSHKPKFKQ